MASSLPTADDWKKTRWLLLAILLIMLGLIAHNLKGGVAAADEVPDLTVALAPFVAIAAAIERFWEAMFGWYESFALAIAKLVGVSEKSMEWMREELKRAHEAVRTLQQEKPDAPGYRTKLAAAETHVQDAQARIQEALKLPEYVALKKSIILVGSLVLGLAIATFGKLQLFHAAGMSVVPPAVDVVLTGLLIGLGPGPLHNLITVLQEMKNALAGIADLTRSSAMKKTVDALKGATPSRPLTLNNRVELHETVTNAAAAERLTLETAKLRDNDMNTVEAERLALERAARRALAPR